MSDPIYDTLAAAIRAEQPVALATVMAGPGTGAKLLVGPSARSGRDARRPRPRPGCRP